MLALIVVVVLAVVLSRDDGDDTATDDVTTTTTATDDTEPETTTTVAPETTVAGPQDADVFSLAVGDCLVEETPDGEVQSLPVVPCDQPRASEIYYLHMIEGDSLPGPDEMESIASDECLPQSRPTQLEERGAVMNEPDPGAISVGMVPPARAAEGSECPAGAAWRSRRLTSGNGSAAPRSG